MEKKTKTKEQFRKVDFLLIGIIILLAFIFRLYKINNPLADHHSWRQADTASVARNFVKEDFNLLFPKYDDLSNIQSGKYNPQGYRFVEFPLYNAVFALLYQSFPFFSLEIYGRLVTIFFSLIIIVIIYYLVFKEEGRVAAFFSSFIFSIMPFFVFYSRTILPETTAVSLVFLSLLTLYLYKESYPFFLSFLYYLLSIIFFSFSLLIKPTTIFFSLPLIYLFYKKFRLNFLKKITFYLFFFFSFIPLILWRVWINRFPEGVPAYEWLFFSVNTPEGLKNIFFKPAFFRWIFKERIASLILGDYLVVFLIIGLLKKPRTSFLFFWIAISSLIYLFLFQGGNIQHDYYQILILPTLAIFSGIGIQFLLSKSNLKRFTHIFLNIVTILILILLSFFFSFYEVKNFYSYSKDLVTIAQIIKTLVKEEEKIITDTAGDTTLLYLSERKGYPAVTEDLESLKKRGGKYFVTFNNQLANQLRKKYQLIFESNKVYILKL